MTVVGFYHAGVTVKDLDASLRFYVDGLGLELSFRVPSGPQGEEIWRVPGARASVAFLAVPASTAMIELFEFHDVERHPASARPPDYGAGHLCLYVDGVDALYEHLSDMGYIGRSAGPVLITGGKHAGAKAIYMIDPDGYHVELYELPRA